MKPIHFFNYLCLTSFISLNFFIYSGHGQTNSNVNLTGSNLNNATDFNGASQYLNIPAKNLLNADRSIAYAAASGWLLGGNVTSITRVVLADEEIVTTGLPNDIKTAYKFVADDASGNVYTQSNPNLILTAAKHFFSGYVILGSN